jgi:transposase
VSLIYPLLVPLPGETLFSLISRHHYISGQPIAALTCEAFFGHPQGGSQHDLPSRLAHLAERANAVWGNAEIMAKERTLLAYYRAFFPREASTEISDRMFGNSVAHLKFRMGLLTSRFRANHPLKACRACMAEDRAKYGWAYWHLNHQYPGVWTCTNHHELLLEGVVKSTGVQRFQWHLPEEDNLRAVSAKQKSQRPPERACLKDFSLLVEELVAAHGNEPLDMSRLQQVYRAELGCRNWLTPGGNLRLSSMAKHFGEFLKPFKDLIEFDSLPCTETEINQQLGRLLRPRAEATHPLRHCLMINWLFGSMERFSLAYRATLDRRPESLKAEALRPGTASDLQREKLVSLVTVGGHSMRVAARQVGIDVGTAITWAGQAGLSISRRPKKLHPKLRQELIARLRRGMDKDAVAKSAELSVVTVTKLLLSEPGLHAEWTRTRKAKMQSRSREVWVSASASNPDAGVKLLRALHPAAYAWLYRNDREWLNENKPAPCGNALHPPRRGVDWLARDLALSAEVSRVGRELRHRSGSQKVKLWQIYQVLPALKAKLPVLHRMPLTKSAIAQLVGG